jgi:hypothetical protein
MIKDPSSHPEKILWTHKKTGNLYEIVTFAINEAKLEILVIYSPARDNKVLWSRPAIEFFDGRFVPHV